VSGAATGGVVSDVASPVPTGKTVAYKIALESAAFPAFMQRQVYVEAGAYLEAYVNLYKDASMAYLPRVQIVDAFADPLVAPATRRWPRR